MNLRAAQLVRAIDLLPKETQYHYIYPGTKTVIKIQEVNKPEGPIIISRYNPYKGEKPVQAKEESISTRMLWRIANAFEPNVPINFDRVLGASYNTRSALEALLAHTPEFYYCYPGRIEHVHSSQEIKKGHKHLMWCPDKPHENGILEEIKTNIVISEIPSKEAIYDELTMPKEIEALDLGEDIQRRHAQIQIAIILIGHQLGFKSWIAKNDQGIIYKNIKIGEMEGVIPSLRHEGLLSKFRESINKAEFIDCIWFQNNKMPAVMEIEHSTGITSGLTRMKKLQDSLPPFLTRYVIVAADEDRDKVFKECNQEQFKSLEARFFPYSAVEELFVLCQKRKISGIKDKFLDSFMEKAFKTEI